MMRASVGVATSRRAGDVPDDLLRDADIAMYMAKRRGKGRYEVYESGMSQSMVERLELLADLQHALEREEFALHYQPTIDLHDGRMVGMEALVRWRHPGRGLLPPTLFIPLAEESGAIHALGVWVLREACKQAKRWQERYESDPPWSMSVNVSVMQIQPRLVGEVAQVLEETGLDPGTLILEVTESVMMQDATPVIKVLEQIRALGVRIAIDDFGTGYSSLSYLQNLPFDLLKIDRSFVTNSSEDRNGNEITRAIIGLGKTLHVGVIAEGIETDEQLVHLRQLECEFGQGFYFSQPLDTEGMERLLEAERARRQAA
jgi:EAL domain-containing protein (putative c-di-GMP-specific phosphodiesterase class I)